MSRSAEIAGRRIGHDEPAYLIAEIGINHNGDLDLAIRLIDAARVAGCDAVKFQKRTPEECVPPDQRERIRSTPWGDMTYMDYRRRVEFGEEEYLTIDAYCRDHGMTWFASVWDPSSVDFLEAFEPAAYKLPSAMLTNLDLIRRLRATGRPLILSTGMSTLEEIRRGVETAGLDDLVLLHSTSTYPCPPQELNLNMIGTLRRQFDCPIGYSGHEVGLQTTVTAVALGACAVERHVTLDRAMWGSDQAASVEPWGLMRLVRDIQVVQTALGDGVKQVYGSEQAARAKLRMPR